MSRIGRKIIEVPSGVEVFIEGRMISIKGPKGTVLFKVHPDIEVIKQENVLNVAPVQKINDLPKQTKALWGTTRQIISNMIQGVTKGYEKKLEVEGVGFRALIEGDSLVLYIGFTNPVRLKILEGLKVAVEKNVVVVTGFEKDKVGQFSALVKAARPVEPYKGKGIKYQGEQVRRKLGKRAAATAGAGAK